MITSSGNRKGRQGGGRTFNDEVSLLACEHSGKFLHPVLVDTRLHRGVPQPIPLDNPVAREVHTRPVVFVNIRVDHRRARVFVLRVAVHEEHCPYRGVGTEIEERAAGELGTDKAVVVG